jgi:hypothetical protein
LKKSGVRSFLYQTTADPRLEIHSTGTRTYGPLLLEEKL